jgi:glycosyltransferase involved in cell wall biosynthesis
MFEYKISIVVPVFNANHDLPFAVESILNQTMDLEDIEVVFVDDASTDNSLEIINKYCEDYSNFKVYSLDENVGAAYGPRNFGLKHACGEFVMFLDSDDQFHPEACETLYHEIKDNDNVDIVFARYLRVFPEEELILKSYSPYTDNINEYMDDLVEGVRLTGAIKFFWEHLFSRVIYGSKKTLNHPDIFISDVREHPELFKILPSIWTKIYRMSFIREHNLHFPSFISGEDLNFVVASFFLTKGIVFLNETVIHDYYMREKSITKNINYKLVYDSLRSYYSCSKICKKVGFKKSNIILNPFLLNWISLYKQSECSKEEKQELYTVIKDMGKVYKSGFVARFLVFYIKLLLKT